MKLCSIRFNQFSRFVPGKFYPFILSKTSVNVGNNLLEAWEKPWWTLVSYLVQKAGEHRVQNNSKTKIRNIVLETGFRKTIFQNILMLRYQKKLMCCEKSLICFLSSQLQTFLTGRSLKFLDNHDEPYKSYEYQYVLKDSWWICFICPDGDS